MDKPRASGRPLSFLPGSVDPAGSGLVVEELSQDIGPEPPLMGDALVLAKGMTLLYGKPESGKGWTGVFLVSALVHEGHHPMVLDFENDGDNWKRRCSWAGVQQGRSDYIHMRKSLDHDVHYAELRTLVRERGVTYLILDSATMAMGKPISGDMGGANQARTVIERMEGLGLPFLVIAHIAKGKQGAEVWPYGSMVWMAEARLAWHASAVGQVGTSLACTKRTGGPRPGVREFQRTQGAKGIIMVERAPVFMEKGPTQEDMVFDLLTITHRSMSMAEIRTQWIHMYGVDPPSGLKVVLARMVAQRRVDRIVDGRSVMFGVGFGYQEGEVTR